MHSALAEVVGFAVENLSDLEVNDALGRFSFGPHFCSGAVLGGPSAFNCSV